MIEQTKNESYLPQTTNVSRQKKVFFLLASKGSRNWEYFAREFTGTTAFCAPEAARPPHSQRTRKAPHWPTK